MANLEQMREAWEACAEAYDRALTATDMRAAEEALRLAGVRAGMRFLDIAAGPGALSIPAARLGADVLAVDYSHAMVELLNRKATKSGLSNLRTRWMDGTALELADDTFEVAGSELGIMLFPDRARGLREMARVVVPGGKGLMVVLGPLERVQAVSIFFEAMARAVPGFTPPANSPLFCLQDLDTLGREMQNAGFGQIQTQSFESSLVVDSAEDLWETILAGAPAIAGLMRQVPGERQRAVRAALIEIARSRFGTGRISLPIGFNIGVGTK